MFLNIFFIKKGFIDLNLVPLSAKKKKNEEISYNHTACHRCQERFCAER